MLQLLDPCPKGMFCGFLGRFVLVAGPEIRKSLLSVSVMSQLICDSV